MRVLRTAALLLAAFVLQPLIINAQAQVDQSAELIRKLTAIEENQSVSPAQRQTEVIAVRQTVGAWLSTHPGSGIELPPPPRGSWTEEQTRSEILRPKQAVESIAASDSSKAFELGVMVVDVTAPGAALSPVSDHLDHNDIENHNATTVAEAIEYLPGVTVDHKSPRNQTGVSIGGFDSRQVPLHLDGVPAYSPLDGFVDLSRYLTSDVAEIQVAKGYSSPLLGPNLLGGVVNLVTRQPQKPFEADSLVGTGPGGLLNSGLHLGSRWRQLFFQGAIDRLQSHFYPLSGAATLNATQPTDSRVNSAQRDERYRLRVGWSPRSQDSYVVSYSNQRGKSGVPPYSGSAPVCPTGNATLSVPCVTPKYWKWPTWNTDSLYFNSRTALSRDTSVQFRAFYVRYANNQSMFDDATYTTMNVNASSGISNNRDHSFGLSGDFETRRFSRNTIGASFFVNNDTHREQTTTFSRSNVPSTTALQTDRDRQSSFGLQDIIKISSRITATLGISADNLNGLQAQDLSSDKTFVVPFQVAGICNPSTPPSFKDCTDHVWTYNPVASLSYQAERAGTFFITAAEKSRFPTLKDRYSYKAGRAIPNPALEPERARTWTAGYSRAFARRAVGQIGVFRSDLRDGIQNTFFLSPLCTGGGKGGAGTCQQAVNIASEIHDGVNLSVRSTPVPRLTFDANYSYVQRKINGTTNVFPTGVPKHKSVATLTMRLPRGATALVSERYQSGAVGMADNSLRLPVSKFARTDIGGTLPIRVGFRVQLGIENLFDRNYFYWEGFPEAGRNWYGTLRYTF